MPNESEKEMPESMLDDFEVFNFVVPVSDVRKGDNIKLGDNWYRVHDSHFYMGGIWGDDRPQWSIGVMKSEQEWPWDLYPTYGEQKNDDYDGPEYVLPYDCQTEHEFLSSDEQVLIRANEGAKLILDPTTLKPIRWWVVVYEADRGYGGPEEGGWWYDIGTVVLQVPCSTYESAEIVRDRLREEYPDNGKSGSVVYSGGDYRVCINKQPGEDYPDHKPHYS